MPLVSIVIPTRDRGYLLRRSLKTALSQRFEDYEVLVSDNSSSDNTRSVLAEFESTRLRYVRTERTLAMPDHWDFALVHARGKYVTYLCDDDAFTQSLLARSVAALEETGLEAVTWNVGWYYHDTWPDPGARNNLELREVFSGETQSHRSRTDLEALFGCQYHVRHPKMQNTLCSMALLDRIRQRAGRVFIPTCPDYSAAAAILALTPQYVFIDWPLALAGCAEESIGASSLRRRGAATLRYNDEFGEEDLFGSVPLNSIITYNYVTDTILRVKRAMPEAFAGIDVAWDQYFVGAYHQLLTLQEAGVDCASDFVEFDDVLRQQPEEIRQSVAHAIEKWRGEAPPHFQLARLAARMRRLSSPRGFGEAVMRRLRRLQESPVSGRAPQRPAVFRGADRGFSDIVECALQIDRLAAEASLVAAGRPKGGSEEGPRA